MKSPLVHIKVRTAFLFVCLLFLLWSETISAAEITLARDGRPTAVIIISQTPTAPEQMAATELQTYLRKIAGATLQIANTPPGIEQPTVRIGVYGAAPVSEWGGE